MNSDQLLVLYDKVADAPDAVARLRRFLLDLAVRGKLVPQDPAEEPPIASGLSDTADLPFDLPPRWQWVRIGDQLELLNGMAFKPADWVPSGLRIVRIQNLNNPAAPFNFCIPDQARKRSLIDDGSFLISWSGTPGTSFGAFIWGGGPAVLNQHIFRCDLKTAAFDLQFLRLAINGRLDEMIGKAHGGVGLQHITKGKLEAMLITLPPIAEQRRIVAKVEELLGLLSRLELARSSRESIRNRLTDASLAELTSPKPEGSRLSPPVPVALGALPALTTRVDQISALRHTIRSLAVQGRLTSQANNGHAIAHAPPNDPLRPFEIPSGWSWSRLGSVISDGPRNGISPKPSNDPQAVRAITLTATTSGKFDARHTKAVEGVYPDDSGHWLKPGDLLFQRGNTPDYVGMAAYYEGPPHQLLYPDLMIKVRIGNEAQLKFVHLCAIAPYARDYFTQRATGAQATMPKINQATLLDLPLPLPPLVEQTQIVATVEAMMVLCDRLEVALGSADTARANLLNSLLHNALEPVRLAQAA